MGTCRSEHFRPSRGVEFTIELERQTLLYQRTSIDCRLLAEAADWRLKLIWNQLTYLKHTSETHE